jgi:hypothetical protein
MDRHIMNVTSTMMVSVISRPEIALQAALYASNLEWKTQGNDSSVIVGMIMRDCDLLTCAKG